MMTLTLRPNKSMDTTKHTHIGDVLATIQVKSMDPTKHTHITDLTITQIKSMYSACLL